MSLVVCVILGVGSSTTVLGDDDGDDDGMGWTAGKATSDVMWFV